MKVVGERALGGKVDDLDDLRKAKVLEAFEKAEIKYKARGAAPVKSAPVVTASAKPKPVRIFQNRRRSSKLIFGA